MSNLKRDIGSEDLKIGDLADMLAKDKFLIPTFQRDFVWNPDNSRKHPKRLIEVDLPIVTVEHYACNPQSALPAEESSYT